MLKPEELEKLKKENQLPAELQGDFEVKGIIPGKLRFKGIWYDLRTITREQAEKLADDEHFRYLVKKQKTSPNASASK